MPILIVPVSHLARESRTLPREVILREKPDYVALELDNKRFFSLFSGQHGYMVRATVPSLLGYILFVIQKHLGASIGEMPGEEFVEAAKAAAAVKAKVALVDQDIEVTLRKFAGALSIQYLARFVALALIGKRASFDISKMPEDKIIEEAMGELKKYFPNLHEVFVEERNRIMAARIATLEGKIVVVIGAGHAAGLKKMLPSATILGQGLKTVRKRTRRAKGKVRIFKNRGKPSRP